jgi:hypothetical protein
LLQICGEKVVVKASAVAQDISKVMSTKEARKILGKDFSKLTDEQIDDLVTKLHLIAKGAILPNSSI